MQADENVVNAVAFSSDSNVGYLFSMMKPSDRAPAFRGSKPSKRCGPRLGQVPGIMAFLQNPPPITINGQFSTSLYQMTVQSVNLSDIYEWTPKLTDKIRTLPGFTDVNSDLLIASPQVTSTSIAIARLRWASRLNKFRTRCTPLTETGRFRISTRRPISTP